MAIISFKYNFIFIKTRKTAGTSIEVDLSQRVEQSAIVTSIYPKISGHEARNFQGSDQQDIYKNHMSAAQIRDRIGTDKFASMYKFCVEREPIKKSISHYHMLQNSKLHNKDGVIISWAEYCAKNEFPVDYHKYSEMMHGKLTSLVDKILPYENLDVELPKLLETLGLADFKLTTNAKSEYSKNILIRESDVTKAQRAQIYEAFQLSSDIHGLYAPDTV